MQWDHPGRVVPQLATCLRQPRLSGRFSAPCQDRFWPQAPRILNTLILKGLGDARASRRHSRRL